MSLDEKENDGKVTYFLNFPTPKNSRQSNDDGDPLVILFGWAGCQDRYLIKYSDIWLQLGCITLRYICPLQTLFWSSEEIVKLTDQLVEEVLDKDGLDLAQNPVVFHLFSGAGCMLLLSMYESLKSRNITLNIKGYVFDSAPGEGDYWSKALAYNESVSDAVQPNNSAQKYFWSYMYYWYFWLYDYVKLYRSWIAGEVRRHETYFQRLSQEHLSGLLLYLYSTADHICTSDSIEKFIKCQLDKRGGNAEDVQSICWTDTMHCQHLRTKSEEYYKALESFVEKLFKNERDLVNLSM